MAAPEVQHNQTLLLACSPSAPQCWQAALLSQLLFVPNTFCTAFPRLMTACHIPLPLLQSRTCSQGWGTLMHVPLHALGREVLKSSLGIASAVTSLLEDLWFSMLGSSEVLRVISSLPGSTLLPIRCRWAEILFCILSICSKKKPSTPLGPSDSRSQLSFVPIPEGLET